MPERRLYYGWVIAVVCMLVMVLASPVLTGFGIFYKAIFEDLGWSRGDTAVAMSIFMVVQAVGVPAAGFLIDRFNARWVIPAGAIVTSLALIWLSRVSSLWEFYIAFGVLASAGFGLIHFIPLSAIVSNWFSRYRGTALGIVTAGQGLAQMAIPFLQYLIDSIGWRNTYAVIGLAMFVAITTLALIFLRSRPEDIGLSIEEESPLWRSGAVTSEPGGPPQRREVVLVDRAWGETSWTIALASRTARFWFMGVLNTFYSLAFMMILVQIFAYLTDPVAGYGTILAASAISVQGVFNILGKLTSGPVSDRIGREKTYTMSIASYLASLAFLVAAGYWHSAALVYLFAVFYGFATGTAFPTLLATQADLFQGPNIGKILGVLSIGGLVGAGLGSWLGGYLYDVMGSYDAVFLLAAAALLASGGLIWIVRPGGVRAVKLVPA